MRALALMNTRADSILRHLAQVDASRAAMRADPRLASAVPAVKRYQGRRFERTYADWLSRPGSRRACRFFLDDLYGDKDFSRRDAEFARVVPALVRLFPEEIVATVDTLGALHALSEELDSGMARALIGAPSDPLAPAPAGDTVAADVAKVDPASYLRIWQATGRADDRERQVALMHDVGVALTAYTRRPMLRRSLKLMRVPAAAAGLSALQGFLEEGFDAFADLPDPRAFLDTIAARERRLMARLFAAADVVPDGLDDPLAQLP
jgi:hypothetical protein